MCHNNTANTFMAVKKHLPNPTNGAIIIYKLLSFCRNNLFIPIISTLLTVQF